MNICADCKYFKVVYKASHCTHPAAIYYSGMPVHKAKYERQCITMRRKKGGICGEAGTLYEPSRIKRLKALFRA